MNAVRRLCPWLPVVALAGLLAGCAARPAPQAPPAIEAAEATHIPRPDPADAAFTAFRRDYARVPSNAVALFVGASFTFTSPKRNNRTVLEFCGNFDLPLRLDVRAGIGTSLAHFREDETGLLAFYPDRREAYALSDPVRGARMLELPLLFSLKELGLAVAGSVSSLVPERYRSAGPGPDGGFVYAFEPGRVESLTLSAAGRPLALTGVLAPRGERPGGPWRLEFSDYEQDAGQALAQRITLSLPGEEKGVLRIKTRELRLLPWPAKALDLALPDGTIVYLLDRQAPPS